MATLSNHEGCNLGTQQGGRVFIQLTDRGMIPPRAANPAKLARGDNVGVARQAMAG